MTFPMPSHGARRIVCGVDPDGRSGIVSDGAAPSVTRPGGSVIMDIWRMDALPPSVSDGDTLSGVVGEAPPPGGAVVRLCTFPPESEMDLEAFERAMGDTYGPQPDSGSTAEVRGVHRTDTVDVVTVLSGELYAVLDSGETLLRRGDSLVQRGNAHAWSNRSDHPATVVAVMIDAKRDLPPR